MVHHCAIIGCKNKQDDRNFTFHALPKTADVRAKWLKLCRKKITVTKYVKVCSSHFRSDCFKARNATEKFMDEALKRSPRSILRLRRLLPQAIPTENLPEKTDGKSKETENVKASKASEANAVTDKHENEPSANYDGSAGEYLNDVRDEASVESSNKILDSIFSSLPAYNVSSKEEQAGFVEHLEQLKEEISVKITLLQESADREKSQMQEEIEKLRKEAQKAKREAEKVKEEKRQEAEAFILRISKLKKRETFWKRACHIYKVRMEYAENKLTFCQGEKQAMMDKLKGIFTPGQMKMLFYPRKKATWSREDIACAISLRANGSKAYEYMRRIVKIPLPGLSSLRRWMESFDVQPGILKSVLQIMKAKGQEMSTTDKLTVISFDEFHLSPQFCIDRKKQKIFGPHKACQVVMARGLVNPWKQVVYYDYDKPMTKNILFDIIRQLHDKGYTVVAMVSDMYTSNTSLWKKLGVGTNKAEEAVDSDKPCKSTQDKRKKEPPKEVYFEHPSDTTLKVHVFADVPHLIKLARNHLLDSFFFYKNSKTDKKYLEHLLQINSNDLKIAFSLTVDHLNCTGNSRQKVKLATQVFSNKNAKALTYCLEQKKLGNSNFDDFVGCEELSRVLQLFNDWFDLFNVRSKYEHAKGFGVDLSVQKALLEKMTDYITTMRVGKHKEMIPFQKGIHLNNLSLQSLYQYLKDKFGIEYILTHRLNQDVLENFFSFIRGVGRGYDHPTALEVKYRLRWYLLGKHAMVALSEGCNVEQNIEENGLLNACDLQNENAQSNEHGDDENDFDVETDATADPLVGASDFYTSSVLVSSLETNSKVCQLGSSTGEKNEHLNADAFWDADADPEVHQVETGADDKNEINRDTLPDSGDVEELNNCQMENDTAGIIGVDFPEDAVTEIEDEELSKCLFRDQDVIGDEYLLSLSDEFKDKADDEVEKGEEIQICEQNADSDTHLENYDPTIGEKELLKALEQALATEKICHEGLMYVAGYVAWRFPSDKSLAVHSRNLLEKPANDWICHISKGHLMYPSAKLVKAAEIMNQEFEKYHGKTFSTEENIFNTVASKTNEKLSEKLDMKVLLCLVRTRTYIRLRQLNRHMSGERKKLREEKKMRKFSNQKK